MKGELRRTARELQAVACVLELFFNFFHNELHSNSFHAYYSRHFTIVFGNHFTKPQVSFHSFICPSLHLSKSPFFLSALSVEEWCLLS